MHKQDEVFCVLALVYTTHQSTIAYDDLSGPSETGSETGARKPVVRCILSAASAIGCISSNQRSMSEINVRDFPEYHITQSAGISLLNRGYHLSHMGWHQWIDLCVNKVLPEHDNSLRHVTFDQQW